MDQGHKNDNSESSIENLNSERFDQLEKEFAENETLIRDLNARIKEVGVGSLALAFQHKSLYHILGSIAPYFIEDFDYEKKVWMNKSIEIAKLFCYHGININFKKDCRLWLYKDKSKMLVNLKT